MREAYRWCNAYGHIGRLVCTHFPSSQLVSHKSDVKTFKAQTKNIEKQKKLLRSY